ncbi:hypothetical protein Pla100_42680 [Neorhodopirellula pilleata]|uniref:Uncharacterized protein n=2 Tax=Neorhodopirellula pilleata TaxID=2714738 RepID=A0A5C5ZZF4_9BACT|nr:hypothetical protein Pla100_42680 [Neorhodopirellula pilleata]
MDEPGIFLRAEKGDPNEKLFHLPHQGKTAGDRFSPLDRSHNKSMPVRVSGWQSELIEAVASLDIARVRTALANGADPDTSRNNSASAAVVALMMELDYIAEGFMAEATKSREIISLLWAPKQIKEGSSITDQKQKKRLA